MSKAQKKNKNPSNFMKDFVDIGICISKSGGFFSDDDDYKRVGNLTIKEKVLKEDESSQRTNPLAPFLSLTSDKQ